MPYDVPPLAEEKTNEIGDGIMEKESAILHLMAKLTVDEITAIKNFLQGIVFYWCRNCKDKNGEQKWFELRDLIGEASPTNWEDTPLIKIYDWHKEHNDYAYRSSMDAGKILYELLDSNKRFFLGDDKRAWKYKWSEDEK